ncbi:cytochrome c oxidase subunit II [Natronosalvus rutilus]|uniref:cytochrome-c oxidase n=1 Tax=Natronosalvus rutilus TaxID=2953753 RepID=A0A9E7SSD4_9EURY|nr:cytochrome c oxidase subunit II [Natronosalvus rutilus]UTF52389.1 cytochrome c oxidase subunit II [Natronosalvus rutilus]
MEGRYVRLVRWLIVATVGSVAMTMPVAAQSANRDLIDGLYVQLLYVALPLTLFVLVILSYAVVRFRDNEDPRPTTEDPALEITWTVATAVILLFVGVSSYAVLASPYLSPGVLSDEDLAGTGDNPVEVAEDDMVVEIVAYQWGWQATYPEANVTTQDVIVVPADRDVAFVMTSRDVIHSFAVPSLGLRQDVFPEQKSAIRTNVYEPGTYQVQCTEFCGAQHAHMRATIVVVDEETYQTWLVNHEGEDDVTNAPAVVD